MLKAVAFDLDCTLYDREAAIRNIVPDQWERFRDRLANVSKDDYLADWLAADSHGHRPKDELYQLLSARFGFDVSPEELLSDFRSRYEHHFVAVPHAFETLAELRAAGYRLGVVTNGRAAVQSAKIRGLGCDFDAVLISEVEGMRKPDPTIFHLAAERLGVEPGECAFVGDHPDVDIAGAAGAGMIAVWLENDIWPTPPPEVRRIGCLSELPGLVSRL